MLSCLQFFIDHHYKNLSLLIYLHLFSHISSTRITSGGKNGSTSTPQHSIVKKEKQSAISPCHCSFVMVRNDSFSALASPIFNEPFNSNRHFNNKFFVITDASLDASSNSTLGTDSCRGYGLCESFMKLFPGQTMYSKRTDRLNDLLRD